MEITHSTQKVLSCWCTYGKLAEYQMTLWKSSNTILMTVINFEASSWSSWAWSCKQRELKKFTWLLFANSVRRNGRTAGDKFFSDCNSRLAFRFAKTSYLTSSAPSVRPCMSTTIKRRPWLIVQDLLTKVCASCKMSIMTIPATCENVIWQQGSAFVMSTLYNSNIAGTVVTHLEQELSVIFLSCSM
jgi:hypothetical protein